MPIQPIRGSLMIRLQQICMHSAFFASLIAGSCLAFACTPKPSATNDTLPAIFYKVEEIIPFKTTPSLDKNDRWNDALNEQLHADISIPNALETRLKKEDREIWKDVLKNIETFQTEKKNAAILSNLRLSPTMPCEPPVSAFSLRQRAQIQITLQMRRNVFWRIGRLEMATNGVFYALNALNAQFQNGHIRNADKAVMEPLNTIAQQIGALRKGHPKLRGNWNPGELHLRMARTAHGAPIFLQAKSALETWQENLRQSKRFEYHAESVSPILQALETWLEEYDELVLAFKNLSENIQTMERAFAPPHAFIAYACIGNNMRRLRTLSQMYTHLLPMQWSLTKAQNSAQNVLNKVRSESYAMSQNEFIASEIETFKAEITQYQNHLSVAEDDLLAAWDDTSKTFWGSLQVFADPIHHHSAPAVENAHVWQEIYKDIVAEIGALQPKLAPEPRQPLNKRGKPLSPFIASVIETLHSPARIDEVERSLLAISELEAHMLSIRDELLRLCKQGACKGFPEAEIANSPRQSAWIVSWQQSPSQERTLGHSLVVIKLCQLHLSRLVQRLAEIYAWFAETSNADLSWKKLKSWQRIWTLYAEPNGTYAAFLRSVANLAQSIDTMAKPSKTRAESETLLKLLQLQSKFFDITVDYARFIDAKKAPPISFDELIQTWDEFDAALVRIDELTQARDLADNPPTPDTTPKRKPVDIPR